MMKWQPIKTAPRDGTEVILFFPSYRIDAVGVYRWIPNQDGLFPWEGIDGWGCDDGEDAPSHWHPLPGAPK